MARCSVFMPGKHIAHLETRSGAVIDAVVIEGGREEARYWHQNVHLPYIAKSPDFRLDRNWNWPRLVSWCYIHERLWGRDTAFFQINVKDTGGFAFPVGQIFVSDGYPFFPGEDQPSIFLWYLTAAPKTALVDHGLPPDLKLMRPLVDIAIQFGFQRGYNGLLTLHAATCRSLLKDKKFATKEDMDLYSKYEKGVCLIPYAEPSLFIRWLRRNDGRYFYTDENRALDLTTKLDYLR